MSERTSRRRRNQQSYAPSLGSVVTAAAVAYGTFKLSSWVWDTYLSAANNNEAEDQRQERSGPDDMFVPPETSSSQANLNARQRWRMRRQRVERCREETANALSDFLPTLRRKIEQLCDTSEETKRLKELRTQNVEEDARRQEEKELWNNIKIKSLTRLVSTVYGHTVLFLVLTVQVHLLGGKLFHEQMQSSVETASTIGGDSMASNRMSNYQDSHRIVLSRTYEYFFEEGVKLLVKAVEAAVESVVGDWDVTDPSSVNTTKDMLDKAIVDICKAVDGRGGRVTRRSRSILRFFIPPEEGLASAVSDDLAQSILDESLDVLESPVYEDAQRDCLEKTFAMIRDESWSRMFRVANGSSEWTTKPLANVVTKLKTTSNSFYERNVPDPNFPPAMQAVNLYLPTIERVKTVLELGDVSFN